MKNEKSFWSNFFLIVTDIAIIMASINLALYLNQNFKNTAGDFLLTILILGIGLAYKLIEKIR